MALSNKELWERFARTVTAQSDSTSRAKRLFVDHSWQRSRLAGVERSQKLFRRIEDSVLEERLHQNAGWLQVAIPLLDRFSRQLEIRHVLYATDPRGVVLYSAGDPIWRAVQSLMPGYDWSESAMGTNGAGTAIATNQPVAVIGPEHYLDQFSRSTCLAAPLHAPNGRLMGAVDLSTAVEAAHPEQLWDVISLSQDIEAAFAESSGKAAVSDRLVVGESGLG